MGSSSPNRGENKKYLKPQPSNSLNPPWNYPGGVVPLQTVEGHYLFSTKWVGLDDVISTKWSAQRKQYKMTGHIHKQVILDEERNSMLYRSCSGGTCPCIKTKTHFVDMLRVTPIRFGHLKNLGKGSLQNDSRFLNITQDTPRCSNKNLYKMSLWKNIYEISPSSIQKWSLQNVRTQPHFLGKTLPGIKWWFMRGTCPPILCRKFQGGFH